MEAGLNALMGGVDYSNGAIRWDGYDLAAKGFGHIKARTFGIEISEDNFKAFKAAWPDKIIKAFSGGNYNSFSTNFTSGVHLATEGENTSRCLLMASGVHGRTIFWRINQDPIYKLKSPISIPFPVPHRIQYKRPNEGYTKWKSL